MSRAKVQPPREEVEVFAARAREVIPGLEVR
jgi:hypothetical protein